MGDELTHVGYAQFSCNLYIVCVLVVTCQRGVVGQDSAPTRNVSSTVSISTTNGVRTTTTTTFEQSWPECPEQGCLPCPENAMGRPDCTCVEGYTITGKAGDTQEIAWDSTRGWMSRCIPVACGVPPAIPHAERADDVHVEEALVYPERARYICYEGYEADKPDGTPIITLGNFSEYSERLIETQCTSNGTLSSVELMLCVPICGDSRLMATDHLPMYDLREQCDDGNRMSGDGCNALCGVESGFVCTGGTPNSPDRCKRAEVWTDSVMILRITGHRLPTETEISDATLVAMAEAVGVTRRDMEIVSIFLSQGEGGLADNPSANGTVSQKSLFHGAELSAQVNFRVKISDPEIVSLDHIVGNLRTPSLMKPKLWVAYIDRTSFHDLYVQVVDVQAPQIEGDRTKGVPKSFTLSGEIKQWIIMLSPVYAYLFVISMVAPLAWWCVRIRRRRYNLHGRFKDVAPEFKGNWAFNICTCLENKCMFLSLLCCLPARLADTWDAMGFLPYWAGVRRATCCCTFYLCGLGFCGAIVPAKYRSDMRDFFGFGDAVEGNTEFADYCCYVICPVCCVVQEARHVDSALAVLSPPLDQQEMEYQYDVHGDDEPQLKTANAAVVKSEHQGTIRG